MFIVKREKDDEWAQWGLLKLPFHRVNRKIAMFMLFCYILLVYLLNSIFFRFNYIILAKIDHLISPQLIQNNFFALNHSFLFVQYAHQIRIWKTPSTDLSFNILFISIQPLWILIAFRKRFIFMYSLLLYLLATFYYT